MPLKVNNRYQLSREKLQVSRDTHTTEENTDKAKRVLIIISECLVSAAEK